MIKCFFAACLLFLVPSTAQAASPPAHSIISDIQKAIDANDYEAFSRHVDVSGLVAQAARAFVDGADETTAAELQSQALPSILGTLLKGAKNPWMRGPLLALIAKEGEQAIRYGIESGLFSGSPNPNATPAGLLAPHMPKISPGRKILKAEGKAREDADGWVVPVVFHDAGNGNSFHFDLRLTRQEGEAWRVVGIPNIAELLSQKR